MSPKISSKDLSVVLLGGDERSEIKPETGRNKYHLNPLIFKGLLNRGSCTNSTLNEFSAEIVERFLEKAERKTFESLRKNHEKRLKKLLNYRGEDNFECFFAPSGSDLTYLPILFSKILHPEREIVNFLTCPEELGSGTIMAAEGKYFMGINQFGEQMQIGKLIAQELAVEVIPFRARAENGEINNHRDEIIRQIALHPNFSRIGSLVIGSKSGIEDNVDIVHDIDEEVMWVVDLCQFRNSKRLINKLLNMNCMVMLTGSKFYESPPFSGVMLLPQRLVRRLKAKTDGSVAQHFDKIFSRFDCPEIFSNIRENLPAYENYGLLARWECAISEMEAFDEVGKDNTKNLIKEWNALIVNELNRREAFELIPNQEITNKTIVSFRVKKDGQFLDKDQLTKLHKALLTKEHTGFDGVKTVNIGQPVVYGDQSFIRLAVGSHGIRELLKLDPEVRYFNDLRLLDLIEETVDLVLG